MKDIQALEGLLAAKMPIVAVESHEESKVQRMIERFAALNDRTLWQWSVTEGLRRANGLEGAYNTWTSLLTSGHNVSRDVAVYQRDEGVGWVRRAFWGIPPYALIALVFGLYVRLGIQRQHFGPWLFWDPAFLSFAFSWPYHFLAAAGAWGFTIDKFY